MERGAGELGIAGGAGNQYNSKVSLLPSWVSPGTIEPGRNGPALNLPEIIL